MALALVQLYARSQWRLRAVFSGGNPSGQLPTSFAITRADGGPTTETVAKVQSVDVAAVELVLSEALLKKAGYVLTWSAQSLAFQFNPRAAMDPEVQPPNDDPEAEAYGVDLAWMSAPIGPDGDCPRRSGIACVEYDLPNRADLVPAELIQFPSAGAGLSLKVNGSDSDLDLIQDAGNLEEEFRLDDRISDASIDTHSTANGDVNWSGQVLTKATGLPVNLRNT